MNSIVLFGASKLGELAFDFLESKYSILYYCDNNSEKWGKQLKGIEIISPYRLHEIKETFEVIIASSFVKEIEKQLVNELNILEYRYFEVGINTTINGKGYLDRDWVLQQSQMHRSIEFFLELQGDKVGRTEKVTNKILKSIDIETITDICEIGPGAGIFTRRIIEACSKLSKYIIYETDVAWAKWLQKKYPVVRRQADGKSLKYEADKSFSLVHSHAVFVYLNPIDTFAYFNEMIRITANGGYIVFDYLPTENLNKKVIDGWLASDHRFPHFIPEKTVKEFFEDNGVSLISEFMVDYANDSVKYLIYQIK